jgi:diguanylate cyclase (GGDEF)-like protein/putative nucleotidyltransferase with HDIG domain
MVPNVHIQGSETACMSLSASIRPSLFKSCLLLLGCVFALAVWIEVSAFHPHDLVRFLTYLALTLIAASVRIEFPGQPVSFSFVLILLSAADLSLPETVCLALAGGAGELLRAAWRGGLPPQGLQAMPALLRLMDLWIAASIAYQAFHLAVLEGIGIAPVPRLAIAATFYYLLVSSGPLTSLADWFQGRPAQLGWNRGMFTLYVGGALVAGVTHVAGVALGWPVVLVSLPVSYGLGWAGLLVVEGIQARKQYSEYLAQIHLRTVEVLALAIGARDHAHPRLGRLQFLAVELGRTLQLGEDDLQALSTASLLHDIGKLAIPEHILNKPGKLTPEEYEKIKIHPIVGADILARPHFPYPVADIVRSHHERWDGAGYPYGLRGEQIPLAARVLAVVDCLDALTSDGTYRRALSLDAAMSIILEESGKSYDPQVVEALRKQYQELEVRMQLSEKSKSAESTLDESALGCLKSIGIAQQELLELSGMLQDLNYSASLHEVLPQFASRLKKILPFDAMVVHGVENGRLKPRYVHGEEFAPLCSLDIPVGQGVAGTAAQMNQPICNADPNAETEFAGEAFSSLGSLLAVPLTGNESVAGVLSVYRRDAQAFSADDLRIGMAVAAKLGLCLENAAKFRQLESSATLDFITGLPNSRALFGHLDAELSRCRRSMESLAVLVCDLDGFKAVNDRFGHLRGNTLLQMVGQRLRECCRPYDYVARMGGDEFVILMPGLEAENLPDRLATLQAAVQAAGYELLQEQVIGVSAGCAIFPADGVDAEALLSQADRRMYSTKNQRKWNAADHDPVTLGLVQLSRQTGSPDAAP